MESQDGISRRPYSNLAPSRFLDTGISALPSMVSSRSRNENGCQLIKVAITTLSYGLNKVNGIERIVCTKYPKIIQFVTANIAYLFPLPIYSFSTPPSAY